MGYPVTHNRNTGGTEVEKDTIRNTRFEGSLGTTSKKQLPWCLSTPKSVYTPNEFHLKQNGQSLVTPWTTSRWSERTPTSTIPVYSRPFNLHEPLKQSESPNPEKCKVQENVPTAMVSYIVQTSLWKSTWSSSSIDNIYQNFPINYIPREFKNSNPATGCFVNK